MYIERQNGKKSVILNLKQKNYLKYTFDNITSFNDYEIHFPVKLFVIYGLDFQASTVSMFTVSVNIRFLC